ncbi:MAG TPA: glycosyltransferase family 87 protein [Xanthobacteraceae bacterium]|nr:glycosyltransferase family 87 protein [Xanthobacteraceae bacterium]
MALWGTMTSRLATGAWLEPPLVTFAAGLMLAGTVVSLGLLFITADGTLDLYGRPLGTDFSSFWTAGRMALEGQAAQAYEWKHHLELQKQTHGTDLFFPWSYPPVFLLVAAAAAALPYLPALAVWQGGSALAALAAFRQILPTRRALLIAAGFPAVLICLGHGQTGFLTAALLAGGVLLLPRHEIAAGVLFGLLAYKPQFGILIPAVLLAGGYWRAIGTAGLTVIATFGLTLALWGWPVWQAFFDSLSLTRTIVFETGNTGFEKFQSIFAWVRLWGGPLSLAYGAQVVVTVVSTIACIWIWRSDTSLNLKGAALLTGAMLSSPYVLDYDLIVFGMALAFLAAHAIKRGFQPWEKTLLAVAWFTPIYARAAAQFMLLPLGFLTLLAVFAWIVCRVRAEQKAAAVLGEPRAA